MIERLIELCTLNGVSGCEDEVREFILARLERPDIEVKTDAIGNILAFKRGKSRPACRLMVCAHMDEVGFIVKSISTDGYLRFDTVGGIDRRLLPGKPVAVGPERLPGIIGIKAVHLTSPSERETPPKVRDLYIDIGASNEKEAKSLINPGDYAAFTADAVRTAGSLRAKALDDRIGCEIMLQMLESELEYDTWFAFTAQEECGLRGAASAAFVIEPDIALILETTTAADLPEVKGAKAICRLRGGAVISYADGGALYDRELFAHLRRLADENKIPWQLKTMLAGGTDAGRIHISRSGVRCTGLALPVRYLHSPASLSALSDIESMRRLAFAAVNYIPALNLDQNPL